MRKRRSPTPRRDGPIAVLLGERWPPRVVLVLLVAAIPFWGALGGDFLRWDDRMLLVDNTRWLGPDGWRWMLLDSAGGDFGPYMPLTWLSYRLDHALHGLDARAFLITNLVLHALAACALLGVALRLLPLCSARLRERPRLVRGAALAATLLWAAHPLRVEAVDWIAQRREVLSGVLLLTSLGAWLRFVGAARPWWRAGPFWTSLLLFAAAMLAKSTPMGWPLVLLLLDAWPLRRGVTRATLVEKLPFVGVGVLVASAAWAGQMDTGALADVSLPGRLALGAHGAALLVAKSVLPVGLHTHYLRPIPFDATAPAFLVPALVAVAGTAAVLARARRAPAVAVAWASALLLLAPVSGLVPIGSHAFADRYTYLAALPLTLLAAGGAAAVLASRPRVAGALAAVAVLSLGVASAQLATTWRSTRTLFERVVAHEPDSWFAHFMLGALAAERGENAVARTHFEDWVRLRESADAHARLATLLLETGDDAAGVEHLRRALAIEPGHALAHEALGTHLAGTGDTVGAEREWRQALAADSARRVARLNLALLLSRTDRADEARKLVRAALADDPHDERARSLAARLGVDD